MKYFLLTIVLFISAASFAQNSASLTGRLLDLEANNEPLKFAEVTLKETGAKVLTDDNGNFTFKNLNDGIYTVACSFVGYENAEIKVEVVSGAPTSIIVSLQASTISIEDIMMSLASAN